MSITLGLLLAASIFAGGRYFYDYWSCPASCTAFKWPGSTASTGGEPRSWMITNIVLVTWAYIASLVHLFGPTSDGWRFVKNSLRPMLETCISSRFRECLKLIWDFLGSSVFETLYQLTWFSLGVQSIVVDWKSGQRMLKHPDDVADYLQCEPISAGETGWGFGQIFPIFMLILPLMAILETYENQKESRKRTELRGVRDSTPLPTLSRHESQEVEGCQTQSMPV